MLKDKKGQPLKTGNIEKQENKKLRGQKLAEIQSFMKSGKSEEEEWKDRALKASSYLDWFIERTTELVRSHDALQQPGVWDQSPVAHGMSNGLVLAMAIFLEERGNPPFHRAPRKYVMDKEELFTEAAKGFIIDLVTSLEAILCITESGKPKGYEEYGEEEAFAQWHSNAIDRLLNRGFTITEVEAALDRIINYAESQSKNGEDHES